MSTARPWVVGCTYANAYASTSGLLARMTRSSCISPRTRGEAMRSLSFEWTETKSQGQLALRRSRAGQVQDFQFTLANLAAGPHKIEVDFVNDAYGGSPAKDRNLYVNSVDVDGTHYGSSVTPLYSNGAAMFNVLFTH